MDLSDSKLFRDFSLTRVCWVIFKESLCWKDRGVVWLNSLHTQQRQRQKQILRFAKDDKQKGNGKGEMRGFFAALRMTISAGKRGDIDAGTLKGRGVEQGRGVGA